MNIEIEKRQYERFLFSSDVSVLATLTSTDSHKKMYVAEIKNLSKGGMGLKFNNVSPDTIHEGGHFIITKIDGIESLQFLTTIKVVIRWIMNYKPSLGIRSGCEFLNISDSVRKEIGQYINIEIDRKLIQADQQS